MTGINNKPVGHPVKKGSKISMGGVLTFVLILLLVGPLLLFSTLNPTNELNNLTNADLTVELSFIYKNKLMKNYTLYQNLNPQSIEPITEQDLEDYNYTKCIDTKNFPKEQIETVTFFVENDKNWDLSLPHINNLIELIQSRNKKISQNDENYIERIDLVMDYNFYRKLPPEAQEAKKRYNSTIFIRGENYQEGDENLGILGDALRNCSPKNITFKNFFSPPIRLRASSHPKALYKENKVYFTALDVQLGFEGCRMINDTPNYLESYFTFSMKNEKTHKYEGIKFHIFSDKVSKTTQSYSAITFYAAFILVIGNYIRNFFTPKFRWKGYFACYVVTSIFIFFETYILHILGMNKGVDSLSYSYDNVLIYISAIFLFLSFSKLKIRSKIINWVASSAFYVYIIQ